MRERSLNRAERLVTIEKLLYQSPDGFTALELANRCGVHRATIYRDIESLSKMDVPLWEDRGRFGVDNTRYLARVRLSLHEALALYIAARLLAHHSDERNPHVASALDKLAQAMPSPVREHMADAARAVAERPSDGRIDGSYITVLETIARAWAERRRVRIWYRSANSEIAREREFEPYFVEPSAIGYACYVIGHDRLSGALRTFKLERVERAELLPERYQVPSDFDPYPYLSRAWGIMGGEEDEEVRLRFSPVVARRVKESRWHSTQELVETIDGGCLLTVRVAHPLEMKWWIRSWGPEVEVLAPEWLRDEMRREADRLRTMYGSHLGRQ